MIRTLKLEFDLSQWRWRSGAVSIFIVQSFLALQGKSMRCVRVSRVLCAAIGAAVTMLMGHTDKVQAQTGSFWGGTSSWTGFTIGAHGGWNRSKMDFPTAADYPVGPPRPNLDGALIGGQLGYNFQFSQFVVGGVVDYSFANLEKTVRDRNYLTETAKIDRMGSVRAILGYSLGQFLPYVTGGYAMARASYGATCSDDQSAVLYGLCARAGPRSYEDEHHFRGGIYGGGIKYMINRNAIFGVEYLRTSFSEKDFTNGPITTSPAFPTPIDTTLNQFRMTVDFKF